MSDNSTALYENTELSCVRLDFCQLTEQAAGDPALPGLVASALAAGCCELRAPARLHGSTASEAGFRETWPRGKQKALGK